MLPLYALEFLIEREAQQRHLALIGAEALGEGLRTKERRDGRRRREQLVDKTPAEGNKKKNMLLRACDVMWRKQVLGLCFFFIIAGGK